MGSGLILLVLVAASLAVLVPRVLRSYDAGTPAPPVPQVGAPRVLDRRRRETAVHRSTPAGWALVAEPRDPRWETAVWCAREVLRLVRRSVVSAARSVGSAALAVVHTWQDRRAGRGPSTPAVRRRRVLVGLVTASAVVLVAAVSRGSGALLALAAVVGGALAGFLAVCRRQALAELLEWDEADDEVYDLEQDLLDGEAPLADPVPAQRSRPRVQHVSYEPRAVEQRQVPHEPAASYGVGTSGRPAADEPVVPASPAADQRLPSPPAWSDGRAAYDPVLQPESAPARRRVVRPDAAGDWSPVPVPLPTYLDKQVVPPRAAASPQPAPADVWGRGLQDDPPAPADGAAQRRRAVGDW